MKIKINSDPNFNQRRFYNCTLNSYFMKVRKYFYSGCDT